MFNKLVLFAYLLVAAHVHEIGCQSLSPDHNAIAQVRYNRVPTEDGKYKYGHDISNGISKHEKSQVNNGKEGCFSYTSPEGAFVSVVYDADTNGFHPQTRITYPSDTVSHQQHLADPCGSEGKQKRTENTTPRLPVTPQKCVYGYEPTCPSTPKPVTTPKKVFDKTTPRPVTPQRCTYGWEPSCPITTLKTTPKPTPLSTCSCQSDYVNLFSFTLSDGTEVQVKYQHNGSYLQPFVYVHYPGTAVFQPINLTDEKLASSEAYGLLKLVVPRY